MRNSILSSGELDIRGWQVAQESKFRLQGRLQWLVPLVEVSNNQLDPVRSSSRYLSTMAQPTSEYDKPRSTFIYLEGEQQNDFPVPAYWDMDSY